MRSSQSSSSRVIRKYNGGTFENDIALVKLSSAPTGENIPPAQSIQELKACQVLEVTGWGRTAEKGPTSEVLQKAEVPYVETALAMQRMHTVAKSSPV